jgi:hypothetical protein
MNSSLNAYLATAILEDRIHQAERDRIARDAGVEEEERDRYASVTVRLSRPGDGRQIRRLEQLEGRRLPPEPVLVAEAEGRVLAVRSVRTREIVADPFRPTAPLVQLLDLRSIQLRDELGSGSVRGSGRQMRRFLRAVIDPLRS